MPGRGADTRTQCGAAAVVYVRCAAVAASPSIKCARARPRVEAPVATMVPADPPTSCAASATSSGIGVISRAHRASGLRRASAGLQQTEGAASGAQLVLCRWVTQPPLRDVRARLTGDTCLCRAWPSCHLLQILVQELAWAMVKFCAALALVVPDAPMWPGLFERTPLPLVWAASVAGSTDVPSQ